MNNFSLDEIPQAYREKRISLNQACMSVYTIIYKNPARFKLIDLQEDDRSEFLLQFLQSFIKRLILDYDSQICPFGAFVNTILSKAKKTYLKNKFSKDYFDKLYIHDHIYEQSQLLTQSNDTLYVSDSQVEYCAKPYEVPQLVYKRLFYPPKITLTKEQNKNKDIKLGLIILALKSAWYINDEQICKISKINNISSNVLNDSICKLKAKLINKSLCRKKVEHTRNRAYNFINFYNEQKNKNLNDKFKAYEFDKKIDTWNNVFNSKIDLLNSGKLKIAPSNDDIQTVTGIKQHKISYILRKVRALDFNKIKVADLIT